ncbi:MAG: hypothetical protein LBQ24_07825 [Candidatus Peribacteria bacterium]|nr:hypothetical protein [Candidatus Peribacteria bacterium]
MFKFIFAKFVAVSISAKTSQAFTWSQTFTFIFFIIQLDKEETEVSLEAVIFQGSFICSTKSVF